MFQPSVLLAIALGGALGAIARHSISVFCKASFGESFPYGTLVVNLLGCFCLGVVAELAIQWEATHPGRIPVWLHRGIAIGLLGALTTFSTFGHETIRHLERQEYTAALVNILVSVVIGLIAAGAILIEYH